MLLLAATGIVWFAAQDNRARTIGLIAVAFYLATPSVGSFDVGNYFLFGGARHIAVLAFCLVAWLAVDAIERVGMFRAAHAALAFYVASAFVALFSDPLAVVVFLVPTLIGLSFALAGSNQRFLQVGLIGLTLALFAGAHLGLFLIATVGGFTTVSHDRLQFVSASDLGSNAAGVLFGLLWQSGGYVFGRPLMSPASMVALFRIAGLCFMLAAMVAALRRGLRGSEGWSLRFVLALAMLIDLIACLLSWTFNYALDSPTLTGGGATRYLIPAMLFGGVLAALELPEMLRRVVAPATRWMLTGVCAAGVVAATLSFFIDGLCRWDQKPTMADASEGVLGQWLLNHGLTHGVGSYWGGMLIMALSGQKLTVGAVIEENGQLKPYNWVTNRAWYQERPQFVVYTADNRFGITVETITTTYGPPAKIEHIAGYDIAFLAASAR
jgi:hypothetical protein